MNETMADRELDAWLVEHLFGLSVEWHHGQPYAPQQLVPPVKPYSSTGDGMLMVLEAMRGRGAQGSLFVALPSMSGEPLCVARFERVDGPRVIHMVSNANVSAPRAVAEAAKAALEAEA